MSLDVTNYSRFPDRNDSRQMEMLRIALIRALQHPNSERVTSYERYWTKWLEDLLEDRDEREPVTD